MLSPPAPPRACRATAAALLALLLAAPAQALVLASFESGLDGFTTVGDAYRVDTSFDASIPDGSWALYLSTFPNGGGIGDLTGDPIESPRPSPAVAVSVLEGFLGLAAGTLDGISPSGNAITEGSAARLSFTTTAVSTLSLRFAMLTNETPVWSPTWRDFVFTTLTGQPATVEADVDASPLAASGTIFNRDTGWLTVTWADLPAGSYDLGIGVADVQDDNVGTAILLDQVLLVPEPQVVLLFGVGLTGIWLAGSPRRA
jgi:hypothetical protein